MDGWEERTREPEDRTIEITESEKNNRDKQINNDKKMQTQRTETEVSIKF